jgi:hypothetical protein
MAKMGAPPQAKQAEALNRQLQKATTDPSICSDRLPYNEFS